MNVFFTCPTSDLVASYERFADFIRVIKKEGCKVRYDWIEEALIAMKSGVEGDSDVIYDKKIKAIQQASCLIAEGTHKSFTVGHQITIALNKSIPVLLLHKNSSSNKSYVSGIKSEWLTKKAYRSDDEAREIIKSFLETYKDKKRTFRFQLVLTQSENEFLDTRMKVENKSKTDIIRSYIQKNMKK
jgi:hypothetical protein